MALSPYRVAPVPHALGRAFVASHHYAGGAPNTSVFCHGLLLNEELVGVALWLPPTRVAAESVTGGRGSDAWRGVLALSRLAVAPSVPKNGASFLIGRSIRLIRQEPRWHTLLTYADTAQGHTGAIYRATNWTYLGTTAPGRRWATPDGRQVTGKSTVNRTKAEMLALGYRQLPPSVKHKYVMVLR